MMKKIFKGIGRMFLFFLLIAISLAVYFYFIPIYPDYRISDDFFATRFHEQGFDSNQNGYVIWSQVPKIFTGIQGKIDAYSRCYIENTDCSNNMLPEINENNKSKILSDFLESDEYKIEYLNIIEDVLSTFDEITTYDYISTLDYIDHEKLLQGETTKPVITFTGLIQFSRSLSLYYDNASNKDFLRVFSSFYKNVSLLSNKLDSGLIDYLVIITVLNAQFEYLENNIERLSPGEKSIIFNILNEYKISDDMIQNALKADYLYAKNLYNNIFLSEKSLKMRMFYSHSDTLNLLKKQRFELIENNINFQFNNNGRNFIGKSMLKTGMTSLAAQFKKQEALIEKKEDIIQLLSN